MKEILLKPLITEKTTKMTLKSKNKQYAFVVSLDANKIEIKQAIEKQYGVKVDSVRTAIKPAVQTQRLTRKGVIQGKKSPYKKAYVTLKEPVEIDFFNNSD
ncbi:MAG: 50S ribosomal protein L23 [Bacteroidia bacterium]|nr:50S ribosomal protein L23 [Bacteroidia bacterium]MDW8159603.1 50S ribosomal protein L23 [Bacteroidia bacterium]